jgi:hypothetical protein
MPLALIFDCALFNQHEKTFQLPKEKLTHGPYRIEAVIDQHTILLYRCNSPLTERTLLS